MKEALKNKSKGKMLNIWIKKSLLNNIYSNVYIWSGGRG